jgi:hypothetical protein
MAKREKQLYKFIINEAGDVLTLMAGNYARSVAVDDPIFAVIGNRCALHGLKQKAADKGALSASKFAGNKVDPQSRRDAVIGEFERLCNGGAWNAGGGGERGPSFDTLLVCRALELAYPTRTAAYVREQVEKMPTATRKNLLVSDDMKEFVEIARKEAAAGIKVDLSEYGFGEETEQSEEVEPNEEVELNEETEQSEEGAE